MAERNVWSTNHSVAQQRGLESRSLGFPLTVTTLTNQQISGAAIADCQAAQAARRLSSFAAATSCAALSAGARRRRERDRRQARGHHYQTPQRHHWFLKDEKFLEFWTVWCLMKFNGYLAQKQKAEEQFRFPAPALRGSLACDVQVLAAVRAVATESPSSAQSLDIFSTFHPVSWFPMEM